MQGVLPLVRHLPLVLHGLRHLQGLLPPVRGLGGMPVLRVSVSCSRVPNRGPGMGT